MGCVDPAVHKLLSIRSAHDLCHGGESTCQRPALFARKFSRRSRQDRSWQPPLPTLDAMWTPSRMAQLAQVARFPMPALMNPTRGVALLVPAAIRGAGVLPAQAETQNSET